MKWMSTRHGCPEERDSTQAGKDQVDPNVDGEAEERQPCETRGLPRNVAPEK
jgi:hypothetical protein